MSVWGTKWSLTVWDVDEIPSDKGSEVALNTTYWNDCVRLDIAEDLDWSHASSAMLDRDMARALAAKLMEFADTGSVTGEVTP